MSTRCKGCNRQLSFFDYYSTKSDTLPELEDICSECRDVAYNCEYIDVHEHAHAYITENWKDFTKYQE